VPSVVGMTPALANAAITAAGLTPSGLGDVVSGQKNLVMSQSPAAGPCVAAGSVVTYHYRPS
jgi:beta-lactam-binding protein with PASTA domain